MRKDTAVIIPAYKEKDNLPVLVNKIEKYLKNVQIIIVDDSPRGDVEIIKKKFRRKKNLQVLSRTRKLGRGSAVVYGMKKALKDRNIKYFIEMDADLSHDPKDLPKLVKQKNKADLVIGSRYLKKSRIVGWPKTRLLQSKVINFFLRYWLNVKIADFTNGLRLYSRQAVVFIVKTGIKEKGFIALSEILFKLKNQGFSILEVPTTFKDRKFGESSADFSELMKSLFGAFRIRFSEKKFRLNAFAIVGILFTVFNYSRIGWGVYEFIGGVVFAKVASELAGIFVFVPLAIYFYRSSGERRGKWFKKIDYYLIIALSLISIIFRNKQFLAYFFKDDFYLFLNRYGSGYNIFDFGPWLSSHPAWLWEIIRFFAGYNVFPYHIGTLLSHALFGIGVYLLVKYITKNVFISFFSSFIFLVSTIHFEAFQWMTHVVNFGWQGFLALIALLLLIKQVEKNKGRDVPYAPAFMMISVFGAGIARFGAILPIISLTDFLLVRKFNKNINFWGWIKISFRRQWIYYLLAGIFIVARGLINVGSTRPETVTAPFYKIFLAMFGFFVFPPEIIEYLSPLTHLPTGDILVYLSSIIFVCFAVIAIISYFSKERWKSIFWIAFIWLSFFALYFAIWGPHVPVADETIRVVKGSHHLSYPAVAGTSMIYAGLLYLVIKNILNIKKNNTVITIIKVLALLTLPISAVLMFISLDKQYLLFLDRPAGQEVTRTQFFFDAYRKWIPADAKEIAIYFDDDYMKRKDNFLPPKKYFKAYWPDSNVMVIWGEDMLTSYLSENGKIVKDRLDNLYYIFTDYEKGVVENLSQDLRNQISDRKIQKINFSLQKDWGIKRSNGFDSKTETLENIDIKLSKPPVLVSSELRIPSIIYPNLDISIRLKRTSAFWDGRYVNVGRKILNEYIIHEKLAERDAVRIEAKEEYSAEKKNILNYEKLLESGTLAPRIVGVPKSENGVWFLVTWVGSTDGWYDNFGNLERTDIFSEKYRQKSWSLIFIPYSNYFQEVSLNLGGIGNYVRGIALIPLETRPISVELRDSFVSGKSFE